MRPTISVIIPIYNVDKYLSRCIESIISQSYKELEIILVNDGSTDKSGEICDEYSLKDKRIKVIHKENGGLSDARNKGIEQSTGKYIAFVDSDDYILEDVYEIAINHLENNNLDILCTNGYRGISKESSRPIYNDRLDENIYTGIEYMVKCISNKQYLATVWLNIYKRKNIIENKILFEKGILHEDEDWLPRVLINCNRVKYIEYKSYMYIERPNSITTKKNKRKNGIDIIKTCYKLEKMYSKIENEYAKKILNNYLLYIFLGGVYIGKLYDKESKKYINKKFVLGKSITMLDYAKSTLFLINTRLYYNSNYLLKYFKER